MGQEPDRTEGANDRRTGHRVIKRLHCKQKNAQRSD